MKSHRVFVSIPLPDKEKQKLSLYQSKFLFDDSFRITPKEDLHLTLVFVGEIFDEELTLLCQSVSNVCQKQESFDIFLSDITYGPNSNEPRLVWIKGPANNFLENLKSDLEKELKEQGISYTHTLKRFQPHVTIARIKKDYSKENLPLEKDIATNLKLVFSCHQISIMESTLSKTGSTYDILQSYYLN